MIISNSDYSAGKLDARFIERMAKVRVPTSSGILTPLVSKGFGESLIGIIVIAVNNDAMLAVKLMGGNDRDSVGDQSGVHNYTTPGGMGESTYFFTHFLELGD